MTKLTKDSNVLLLGATGQVGYALADKLSKQNIPTTALVRNSDLDFADNINVVTAKTFTADVFEAALKGVDTVIYGIGLPEQFETSKDLFQRVNHDVLKTFFGAVEKSNVKRMVYISTFEVFEVVDGMIRESHALAKPDGFSAYFQSKIAAYRMATDFAKRTGLELTTIHPGAVYGGLNTSYGVTNFIENIVQKRRMDVPFIMPTHFPIVHTTSLTDAIFNSFEHPPQAFIVTEQMTSLREIAQVVNAQTDAYAPALFPLFVAKAAIKLVDTAARVLNFTPIMSYSQMQLMTVGTEPVGDHAKEVLDWNPLTLEAGIDHYLRQRVNSDDANLVDDLAYG